MLSHYSLKKLPSLQDQNCEEAVKTENSHTRFRWRYGDRGHPSLDTSILDASAASDGFGDVTMIPSSSAGDFVGTTDPYAHVSSVTTARDLYAFDVFASSARSVLGVLEMWSFGALELWCTGDLEFWRNGVLEFMRLGGLEIWSSWVLEIWRSGGLEFWTFGVLGFWRFGVQEMLSSLDMDFRTLRGTLLRGSSAEHANKERSGACPA